MIRVLKIVLSGFLVLCFVANVFGIKCFSCNSDYDPKCADPFDNATIPISNCQKDGGRWPMCRKIRQKVDGGWRYTRDCTYLDIDEIKGDEGFCFKISNETLTEDCSCLNKDGCNSSAIISLMPFMMLISVISVFI